MIRHFVLDGDIIFNLNKFANIRFMKILGIFDFLELKNFPRFLFRDVPEWTL